MNTVRQKPRRRTILLDSQTKIQIQQSNIMELLQWSEKEYYAFLFDSVLDFLAKNAPEESEWFKIISADRLYWNWYKLEWCIATEKFARIIKNNVKTPAIIIRAMYLNHMTFFCVNSKRINEAFENYLRISSCKLQVTSSTCNL